ncbi:hypothetical protein ACHWQZ_G007718 [Mnemiopsis leidyi]
MITKIKVDFATYLTEKLGTGPLNTVVYTGTYGPDTNCFKSCRSNSLSDSGKNKPKPVLVKKIEMKIADDDIIDWAKLQKLDHPNVARYILVYDKEKVFQPDAVYIIQDYCQFTLSSLINQVIKSTVLRAAVHQIASGLKYLHDKGMVHMNLKPSNILVKPPLSNPDGFVLTDYAYTRYRFYPQKSFCCCCRPEDLPDDPEITKWMAPELKETSQDEIWTNRTPGDDSDCSILELRCEELPNSSSSYSSDSMADMFSFGEILKIMLEKCESMDELETILCKLLIEQMTIPDPRQRINSADILKKHPFLIIQPDIRNGRFTEARIDYVKELYDRMKKTVEKDRKEEHKLRQQIENEVGPVTSRFFPWSNPSNSFGGRIHFEMNKRPQIKMKYDGNSFINLLRLIRNTKEHPMVEKKLEDLKREVDNDAFSKNFPFVIPLIYICVECPESQKHLIQFLSDIV